MRTQRAVLQNICDMSRVYSVAREMMRENGNPNQWPSHYPPRGLLEEDIEAGRMYVALDEGGKVRGCFYCAVIDDPTYRTMVTGAWKHPGPYAVIHRIARDRGFSGLLDAALEVASGMAKVIRIDTHEDNRVMRGALLRRGFTEAGVILTDNGSPRIAYEKLVPYKL